MCLTNATCASLFWLDVFQIVQPIVHCVIMRLSAMNVPMDSSLTKWQNVNVSVPAMLTFQLIYLIKFD